MHCDILSLSGDKVSIQEFSPAKKEDSIWRIARPAFHPPMGVTAASAKMALKQKEVKPLVICDIFWNISYPILLSTFYLLFGFLYHGAPIEWEYACTDSRTACMQPRNLPYIQCFFSYYGIVCALYLLAMGAAIAKKHYGNVQAENYNLSIGSLTDQLGDDENGLPLARDALLKVLPYLPNSLHLELSWAQMDACREHNPKAFKALLEGSSLKPLQKSFWYLLAHIEEVKAESVEQEIILSQASAIQLLRAEPSLYEKILHVVQAKLLVDRELCHFYCVLLLEKLLTKKFAKTLQAQVDLPKLIRSVACGEGTLLEAFSSLGANTVSLLTKWQASCDQRLFSRLGKEEVELFTTSFGRSVVPVTVGDSYSLLRALKAFKQTALCTPLESKVAKKVGELMALYPDTKELIDEIRWFDFDLLEHALDEHLSCSLAGLGLEAILLRYEKYTEYHLHKTKQALDCTLAVELELLATTCSDQMVFAATLKDVHEIGLENESRSALERWSRLYPCKSEDLYEAAQILSFPWLQIEIERLLCNDPQLKVYWLNPPEET
jgi:hypothetical protein